MRIIFTIQLFLRSLLAYNSIHVKVNAYYVCTSYAHTYVYVCVCRGEKEKGET